MIVNNGSANFRVRRTSGSAVSVTRLEKANFLTGTMIVRDEKSNGTAGGTFTSGAWRTRDLNDVTKNTIAGASLASNRITLPAGIYRVIASAPALDVDRHKIKLANITDSSDALIGSSEFARSGSASSTRSFIDDIFIISTSKVFEVQHDSQTTRGSDGFGLNSSAGVVEVYTMITIQKTG